MICAISRQLILLSLGVVLLFGAARSEDPVPITTLDVNAYMGRWYQTHTTLNFVLLELGGRCTTADYKLESAGKISLINQSRPLFVPKIFARTKGFAVQSPDPDLAGVFTVSQQYLFKPDSNVEFEPPGNYWIIGLGPIEDGQYPWAAVTTPNKSAAWIIVRNVDDFYERFVDDALEVFEKLGGYRLIKTRHYWCDY